MLNHSCRFCGYKFKIGDRVRWIFTNNVHAAFGNSFACERCDTGNTDEMALKWKDMHNEYNGKKFWWFHRKE